MLIFRREHIKGTIVPDLAFLIRCYTTAHGDYMKRKKDCAVPALRRSPSNY